jgi:subtilisin family serine protease
MAKLDARLRHLLIAKDYFEKNPSHGTPEVSPSDPIYISFRYSGDINNISIPELTLGSVIANIAYAATTLAGLQALSIHPQVEAIEKQRRRNIALADSVPDIKANLVWSHSDSGFSGYTGRGIIVGIIDTGIDFTHHAFRNNDAKNSTRILKLWDQTLTAQGGETVPGPITNPSIATKPTPLGYGVEYDASQINDTLENENPVVKVRHVDDEGHGSNVAGIAAGNGSQAGNCHLGFHYVGVAPEADIIAVRMWGLSDKDIDNPPKGASNVMIDAIQYIMNEAANAHKPVAINLSMGSYTGQMDGTDDDCLAVDALLTQNSAGTAIIFGAGNNAIKKGHVHTTVPAGPGTSLQLKFLISAGDTKSRSLSVRYKGSNLKPKLTSPVGGPDGIIDYVILHDTRTGPTINGPGGAFVNLGNVDNEITVEIVPAKKGNNIAGTWILELQDSGSTATEIHAFCTSNVMPNDDKYNYFLENTTIRSTLNSEAAGKESISVGAYVIGGQLTDFSSRGPTLEDTPRTKPDICAPGFETVSVAGPHDHDGCHICCCDCCQSFYKSMGGTSAAAPHITGVAALLLHKNPNLTHTEIKSIITSNFQPRPSDAPPDDIVGWGAGKVDTKKSIDAVAQVNPPVTASIVSPVQEHFTVLREKLLGTPQGPELAGLARKYGREIWSLINNNKRVATIWHRIKGPVWVRLALRAAHTPGMPLQMDADGMPLQEAIRKFIIILKRYASQALRTDLQKYEYQLILVRDGLSLEEMIDTFGNIQTHVTNPAMTMEY